MPIRGVFSGACTLCAVIVVAATQHGCSSTECEPWNSRTCLCDSGAEGQRLCRHDGTGWEPCTCELPPGVRRPAATKAEPRQQLPQPVDSGAPSAQDAATKSYHDPEQQATAEKLVGELLREWDKGRFEPLGEGFSELTKARLNPDVTKTAQRRRSARLGKFQSMEYVEVQRNWSSRVYRFRGSFSKARGTSKNRPEVRVVFDPQGLISDIRVLPWHDELSWTALDTPDEQTPSDGQ